MRVSSTMMTGNYLKQLERAYARQAKLMEQGDGNRIHRPSDDPVAFVRTMTYKNSLSENEQYTQNLESATSWMNTSDAAMVNIKDILSTIVAKTTGAANGTNTDKDLAATAKELKALIEQMVTIGNSQLGDRYIFSGQMDKTQPFSIGEVKDKADIKTLDDTQAKNFGTDQMLEMKGDDGISYYWDFKNDKIYDKDFVDGKDGKGYKEIANDTTIADKTAAIQAKSSGSMYDDTLVPPTKESVTMTPDLEKAFGTDEMYKLNQNGNVYYWDAKNNKIYSENYVDPDRDGNFTDGEYNAVVTSNQGKTQSEIQAAVQKGSTGNLASTIFNKKGQIDPAKVGGNSFNVNGLPGVNLSFTTSDKKVVTYAGDNEKISMPIQNGAATPTRDSVNTTGEELFGTDAFGGSCAILNDIYEVCRKMDGNDSAWLKSDGIQVTNDAFTTLSNAQTVLASRAGAYNDTLSMMQNQNTQIQTDITNESAVAVDRLITELMTCQTLYKMSLSFGSRVLPQSLADYL